MRIKVIIEVAYRLEEARNLIAAGVVVPDDRADGLSSEYELRDEEFEGYPWMAHYSAGLERWDIRFPSPSVDIPYSEHETEFIIDSIKCALSRHINSFVFSDP